MKSSMILLVGIFVAAFFIFFHPIPSCNFGYNFFLVSGCVNPVTYFGLEPNLFFAIVVLLVTGIYAIVVRGRA